MSIVLDGTTGITTPAINAENMAGAVGYFAMSTAPSGYLKANGAAVSRSTYATLFSAIGTTFGAGDGSTTFLLPDLRGEFVRGWDDGRGVDSGRAFGSAQTDAFQAHKHTYETPASYDDLTGGANNSARVSTIKNTIGYAADGANGTPRTAAETRPRNVALLACIKF